MCRSIRSVINSRERKPRYRSQKLVSPRLPHTFSCIQNLRTTTVQGQMFQADLSSSVPFEHFSFCLLQRLKSRKCPFLFDLVSQRHLRPERVVIFSSCSYFEGRLQRTESANPPRDTARWCPAFSSLSAWQEHGSMLSVSPALPQGMLNDFRSCYTSACPCITFLCGRLAAMHTKAL